MNATTTLTIAIDDLSSQFPRQPTPRLSWRPHPGNKNGSQLQPGIDAFMSATRFPSCFNLSAANNSLAYVTRVRTTYVCMHERIYMHVCMSSSSYVCIYVCCSMHICMYVSTYMHVCMYAKCMYLCLFVCSKSSDKEFNIWGFFIEIK